MKVEWYRLSWFFLHILKCFLVVWTVILNKLPIPRPLASFWDLC